MNRLDADPLWYKDAVIYELHVRSFMDGNGDGIGDFVGLTSRLDYIEDLGVSAVWLLPFYPSPLRDDGYDIADYRSVHPAYGTLDDFRAFLDAAHDRGIRVITELVLNHTSDQHPWFQRARRAPRGSPERDFYVWSDTPDRYRDAGIIFRDFEHANWSWDPVAQQYFWHRFYSHQPDLNWDHPEVKRAMFENLDFWMALGVDGMRLDAVPYLFEREGTNCENLPETHALLRELRASLDQRYHGRMLLAEANLWPEDAVQYFGQGDECHMAFHFPIMPRMFMSVYMEDRFPIEEILNQTPAIPAHCQWANFLRNHDELTLEMVTDEERDYMYRVYARDPQARINLGIRRRLAPLLGNHRRTIELVNGLLFSLPGTPVIYYGDEIGMGDNIYLGDRNGVRTPMQWSADRNAGFSRANPQRLSLPVSIDPEYHYETVNVDAQRGNPRSLLSWTKRLIALSRRYRAFGRGAIEFLHPANGKVLALVRRYEDELLLVVANLSRFAQYAELDLSAFRGRSVIELFGRTEFPSIGTAPWLITLGPHAFYWFELRASGTVRTPATVAPIEMTGTPETIFDDDGRAAVEEPLTTWMQQSGWLDGDGRKHKSTRVVDAIPVPMPGTPVQMVLATVEFTDAPAETYAVPLAFSDAAQAARLRGREEHCMVASVHLHSTAGDRHGFLHDALADTRVGEALLRAIAAGTELRAGAGALVGTVLDPAFAAAIASNSLPWPEAALATTRRSNTTLFFGERWVLKMIRHIEEGIHPEVEIGRALGSVGFKQIAPLVAWWEHTADHKTTVIASVHAFVPHQTDARQLALDQLGRFFDRIETQPPPGPEHPAAAAAALCDAAEALPPPIAIEIIGPSLDTARLLGRRTAELHRALARIDDPAFTPEPYTTHYQRSLYQSMRNLVGRTFQALRRVMPGLPPDATDDATTLIEEQSRIVRLFERLVRHKITGRRIRCHGDLRLSQMLYTGKDFVAIDFEGDPRVPLGERRLKRSPLRDVTTMIASFHEAVREALAREYGQGTSSPDRARAIEMWADFWRRWTCSAYVKAYLAEIAPAGLLPVEPTELSTLLECFLVERSLIDLRAALVRGSAAVPATLRSLRHMVRMLP